jgi:hypothetical protein
VAAFTIAVTHLDLGDKNKALEWLDKTYEERSTTLYSIACDPFFDPLRTYPRFQDLLHRMNLPSDSAASLFFPKANVVDQGDDFPGVHLLSGARLIEKRRASSLFITGHFT